MSPYAAPQVAPGPVGVRQSPRPVAACESQVTMRSICSDGHDVDRRIVADRSGSPIVAGLLAPGCGQDESEGGVVVGWAGDPVRLSSASTRAAGFPSTGFSRCPRPTLRSTTTRPKTATGTVTRLASLVGERHAEGSAAAPPSKLACRICATFSRVTVIGAEMRRGFAITGVSATRRVVGVAASRLRGRALLATAGDTGCQDLSRRLQAGAERACGPRVFRCPGRWGRDAAMSRELGAPTARERHRGLLWPSWRTQAGTGTDQWRPLEGGPLAERCKIPLP